jgi:hypothetical protein
VSPQAATRVQLLVGSGSEFEVGLDYRLARAADLQPLEKVAIIDGLGGGTSTGRIWLGDLFTYTPAGEFLRLDVEVVELGLLTEPDINGVIGMGLLRRAVFVVNGPARTFTLAW